MIGIKTKDVERTLRVDDEGYNDSLDMFSADTEHTMHVRDEIIAKGETHGRAYKGEWASHLYTVDEIGYNHSDPAITKFRNRLLKKHDHGDIQDILYDTYVYVICYCFLT